MKCKNCGKQFNPADRASPTANPGAVAQIKYCSEQCARQAENRRFYQRRTKPRREAMRRADKLTDGGRNDPAE